MDSTIIIKHHIFPASLPPLNSVRQLLLQQLKDYGWNSVTVIQELFLEGELEFIA